VQDYTANAEPVDTPKFAPPAAKPQAATAESNLLNVTGPGNFLFGAGSAPANAPAIIEPITVANLVPSIPNHLLWCAPQVAEQGAHCDHRSASAVDAVLRGMWDERRAEWRQRLGIIDESERDDLVSVVEDELRIMTEGHEMLVARSVIEFTIDDRIYF
jgi:hypothetical protein